MMGHYVKSYPNVPAMSLHAFNHGHTARGDGGFSFVVELCTRV